MTGLKLRDHVRVTPIEGGARISDDLLHHSFEVGPRAAALLERVDGAHTAAELAGAPEDEPTVRRLLLLNLVEGAGDAIVERLRQVVGHEDTLPPVVLEGARFACQGSGACCQNYVFGPIDDGDVATLDALPLADAFPHLAGRELFQTITKDDVPVRFLRSERERCVFLDADRRCGLHVRFGAEAKPKICRLYPYEPLVTLEGIRLYDKGSCATFAVSSTSGPTTVEELPRLRPLLPRFAGQLHHPPVVVDEYPCDHGHFDRLMKVALRLAKDGPGTAAETLRAISRCVRGFAEVLRSFPLEPGEPDAAIDRFLALDPVRWYDGEPNAERVQHGALTFSEIFSTLALSATTQLAPQPGQTPHISLPLVEEASQLFYVLSGATARAGDTSFAADDQVARIASVPVRDPAFDALLRTSLRQQLFGTGALVQNQCLPALIRMALIQIMAVYGARLRALAGGLPEARPEDLSWGQMLAVRLFASHDAAALLLSAETSFTVLLEALPAVLALPPPPPRKAPAQNLDE